MRATATICTLGVAVLSTLAVVPPAASADKAEKAVEQGNAAYGKADFDMAIGRYTEAIRLKPKFALSYNSRGVAYGAKGDLDRRLPTTLRPSASIRNMLPRMTTGASPMVNKAMPTRRLPIAARPSASTRNRPRRITTGATVMARKALFDKAIADYTEAIRLDPKLPKPTTTGA